MKTKAKKAAKPAVRNWLAVHAWKRGHGVEPDRAKYTRRVKHKGRGPS